MRPEISVCLAAFNEEDVIAGVLADWWRHFRQAGRPFELLVVDNHSTDRTPDRVREFCRRHRETRLVRNARNLGYSGSCRVAAREAVGRWVLFTDGDGQYVPSDADLFLLALEKGADLVMGRRIKRADPFLRKITSKVFQASFGLLSGHRMTDPNCGFRAWRRGAPIFRLLEDGLPFANPQLICAAADAGRLTAEVPILHQVRTGGQSFYHLANLPRIYARFLSFVLPWRARRMFRCSSQNKRGHA